MDLKNSKAIPKTWPASDFNKSQIKLKVVVVLEITPITIWFTYYIVEIADNRIYQRQKLTLS